MTQGCQHEFAPTFCGKCGQMEPEARRRLAAAPLPEVRQVRTAGTHAHGHSRAEPEESLVAGRVGRRIDGGDES